MIIVFEPHWGRTRFPPLWRSEFLIIKHKIISFLRKNMPRTPVINSCYLNFYCFQQVVFPENWLTVLDSMANIVTKSLLSALISYCPFFVVASRFCVLSWWKRAPISYYCIEGCGCSTSHPVNNSLTLPLHPSSKAATAALLWLQSIQWSRMISSLSRYCKPLACKIAA